MMPQNQFLLNNNISCDVDQLRTYCCCWFRPRLVSPKTLQEINQLQLEPRILFPQALWNPSGCWAIGIPSILWTKGILDLIGYLNWLQDQLGFRMGFNPCDNSVGTSLHGQWGTTQVYLFVNRSQCIAVLLHPKKTSPEPISLSSRGKSRRGILEIGSRPLLIPRAFGQVALNNKVCRSRGHSWTADPGIPGSELSSKPRVFFLFLGLYSTRLSKRFKRVYGQRI